MKLMNIVFALLSLSVYSSVCGADGHSAGQPYLSALYLPKKIFIHKPIGLFRDANFRGTHFMENADFGDAEFVQEAGFFDASFAGDAAFNEAHFLKNATFENAQFAGQADFQAVHFTENVDFSDTFFGKDVDFENAQFSGQADFQFAHFSGNVNFFDASFAEDVDFENCVFKKNLVLASARFEQGIDLRRVDLGNTDSIIVDHRTFFPAGKLHANWKQFKNRIYVRAGDCATYSKWHQAQTLYQSLVSQHKSIVQAKSRLDSLKQRLNTEYYDMTEIFYQRLRDNYLAQNDKASADAVMFELAEQRGKILHEWRWILYGWLMGWGYIPVRFILVAFFCVALPFSWLWYRRFYHLVVPLVDFSIDDSLKERLAVQENMTIKPRFKYFKVKVFNHDNVTQDITLPARVWHVVFFSASVLFGIRFKKEWIARRDNAFLWCVTIEWLLGIVLYILFAGLVKSYEFGYVKGLLGL